jgi:hypothetical protein
MTWLGVRSSREGRVSGSDKSRRCEVQVSNRALGWGACLVGRAGSDRHRWGTRRTGALDQKTEEVSDVVDGIETEKVDGTN